MALAQFLDIALAAAGLALVVLLHSAVGIVVGGLLIGAGLAASRAASRARETRADTAYSVMLSIHRMFGAESMPPSICNVITQRLSRDVVRELVEKGGRR